MPIAAAPAQPAAAHHAAARVDLGVVRAVNRVRVLRGLPRLRMVPSIAFVAALHSRDQAVHGFLSHSGSDGTSFASRIHRVADARVVGETIIGFHGSSSGRSIVRAWMHSPSHRAELLATGYRRIGVGRARSHGLSVVTADFATGG